MVRRLNIYRIATLMILFLLPGCVLIDKVGGDFSHDPDQIGKISAQAKQLINSAFAGIDPDSLRDYHVHIVGADRHGGNDDDTCGAGSFINEHFGNIFHLKKWIIGKVYMSGSGVTDLDSAYSQYVDRLDDLVKNFVYFRNGQPTNGSGKYYILALDCYYDKDGTPRPEKTTFYTPNNIVVELARKHRNKFIPVISVNPYNPNWRDELDKNGEEGVKFVKWLPNAQGIDACDPDIRPYYEKMKYWNMVLITHVGEEKAVEAVNGQKLGNPLRFRVPLEMGVPVIMAHAASLGKNIQLSDEIKRRLDSGELDLTKEEGQRIYCDDLNGVGKRGSASWISNFDLFLRLMKQEKYKGILYGEISAVTQANRLSVPLIELIRHRDLHDRLINGSDYPLPGLNIVIRTKKLMKEGFITKQEIKPLNEIYRVNPLLFDFVVKRTIRLPEAGGSLSSIIFTGHPSFTELENAWFDQQSIQ